MKVAERKQMDEVYLASGQLRCTQISSNALTASISVAGRGAFGTVASLCLKRSILAKIPEYYE